MSLPIYIWISELIWLIFPNILPRYLFLFLLSSYHLFNISLKCSNIFRYMYLWKKKEKRNKCIVFKSSPFTKVIIPLKVWTCVLSFNYALKLLNNLSMNLRDYELNSRWKFFIFLKNSLDLSVGNIL